MTRGIVKEFSELSKSQQHKRTSLAYNVMKNQLTVEELLTHCKSIITFYEGR